MTYRGFSFKNYPWLGISLREGFLEMEYALIVINPYSGVEFTSKQKMRGIALSLKYNKLDNKLVSSVKDCTFQSFVQLDTFINNKTFIQLNAFMKDFYPDKRCSARYEAVEKYDSCLFLAYFSILLTEKVRKILPELQLDISKGPIEDETYIFNLEDLEAKIHTPRG